MVRKHKVLYILNDSFLIKKDNNNKKCFKQKKR